jgi:hypothetical protein
MTRVLFHRLSVLLLGVGLNACATKVPEASEGIGSTEQSIFHGTSATNLPIVLLEWDDYKLIKVPDADGIQVDPCTKKPGVPKRDPNVPEFAWCEKINRCSGTFVAEHWILTASHCGPKNIKVKEGGKWQIIERDRGRPRHFRAGVAQKLSEEWTDFCLGPLDRSGQRSESSSKTAGDCKLDISAYAYGNFFQGNLDDEGLDNEAAAADDVALWFLSGVWPLAVNIDEAGHVVEPERSAKPIAAKGVDESSSPNFELTPWGWGFVGSLTAPSPQDEPAPELHRPPNGGILLSDFEVFEESLQAVAKAYVPGAEDARICPRDSGGPLLGDVGSNADGSPIEAIYGVNARGAPAPDGCPPDGGSMRWARVDTEKKRAWIEQTLGLYPARSHFACRNQVGSREYMECWPKRCDVTASSSGCASGETCLPQGFTFGRSLTGDYETHPPRFRADRCEP